MNVQIAKESRFRLELILYMGALTMSEHYKNCEALVLAHLAYLCLCCSPKAKKPAYHHCSNIILKAYLIATVHSADSKIKSLQVCKFRCFINDELFIHL